MADDGADDAKSADDWGLEVRGYACEVFDDPSAAWELHQERHLIPWRDGDCGLLVDRFDARNLLDDHAQFRQLKKRKRESSGRDGESGGEEEDRSDGEGGGRAPRSEELHRLRFGDYVEEFPDEEVQEDVNVENRFPYEYPEDNESKVRDDSTVNGDEEEADGEPFAVSFDIPSDVRVPKTLKRHNIIQATADKVRGNPQLEVMMKVRLGDNPRFAFLNPLSLFYGYFCFLRDRKPLETSSRPKNARTGGFSLLGDEYQDSDDDADSR